MLGAAERRGKVVVFIVGRVRVGDRGEGFIIIDYVARFGEAIPKLLGWVNEGKLAHVEDVQQGLENAPATLARLFEGKNLGKQLLEIAPPPLG